MDRKMDSKRVSAALDRPTESSYRDDPDAVSMHTTRSDYEYDDVPELPSYSDATEAPRTDNSRLGGLEDGYRAIAPPNLSNFRQRRQQNGCSPTVKIGSETSIRMDAALMDPDHLYGYVKNYLEVVPPTPMVRVQGYHMENRRKSDGRKERERVTDFDIVLSLQGFLRKDSDSNIDWWDPHSVDAGTKAYRGSFRPTRAPGFKQDIEVGHTSQASQQRDLKSWCEDFCSSKSWLRVFRVQRNVLGLDEALIEENIAPLVHATRYQGHLDISFPVSDRNVDIYSPHWINSARITWVRWLFYVSFLWLITWPILYFMTKWWTVYQVDWYFSRAPPDTGNPTSSRPMPSYAARKVHATVHEVEWVRRHAKLIQFLVLDKFEGDWLSFPSAAEIENVDLNRRRSEIRIPDVDVRSGGIRAAFSVLNAGTSVFNQVQGRGDNGWGYDDHLD